MTAADEPGEYVGVCTVICSEEHEGIFMKFVVTS
jgi:heme/copper-type cytochrome/quinol oxidase subunit 2